MLTEIQDTYDTEISRSVKISASECFTDVHQPTPQAHRPHQRLLSFLQLDG